MEEIIVKYIAKHGSQGMFDGIENIVDKPYEWAISKFENDPKMPKNKNGKIANALQALFASYKVTRRRVDELEAENERLSVGVISTKNYLASETIWKEEKVKMQNEIALLRTNNSMLKSSVEILSKNLEEAKAACQFMIKSDTTEKNHSKTLLDVRLCNPVPEMPDLQEDRAEGWEKDSLSFSSQYSDCRVRFPMAPVHTTTTMHASEGREEPMTSTIVRGFNPTELETMIKNIGKFDPAKQDPLDFLKNLEEYAEVYNLTDGEVCVVLRMCLPDTLSGALTQKVKDRNANKSERKKALLEVLGVMSVNWDRISEMRMRKGEHPAAFSERLLEMFKTFSGNPDITKNDVSFKTALINKCDPLTRSAVTMLVTPLSEYTDIIGKMTQFYNNNANSQMKTVKSRHPVAAVGGRECWSNGFHHRPRIFARINSEGVVICYACGKAGHIARHCQDNERPLQSFVCHACGKDGHIARHCLEKRKEDQEVVCFACGLMGHKARRCHLSHKRKLSYHGLLKKIGNLETQLAMLKGNKEAIHTLSNVSPHEQQDCSSVSSRC